MVLSRLIPCLHPFDAEIISGLSGAREGISPIVLFDAQVAKADFNGMGTLGNCSKSNWRCPVEHFKKTGEFDSRSFQ